MDLSEEKLPADLSELERRHHQYEEQLHQLTSKPYLSSDEELEEVRLKKLKLQIKDRMQTLAPHAVVH